MLSPEEPSGNSHGCSQVKSGPGQRPPKERSQVRDHRPQARLRSMTVLGGSGSHSRTHRPICGPSLSARNHVTMMDRTPQPRHELGTSLSGQAHRSTLLITGPEPACAHCLPPNSSLVLRPRESEPLRPTPASPRFPSRFFTVATLPHLPPGTSPSPQPWGLTSPPLPLEGQPPAGMARLPPPGVPTHRSLLSLVPTSPIRTARSPACPGRPPPQHTDPRIRRLTTSTGLVSCSPSARPLHSRPRGLRSPDPSKYPLTLSCPLAPRALQVRH